MKTIHKFPIRIDDAQDVMLPFGAHILTAAYQGDTLCLWAMVESDNTPETRRVLIYGTGHQIRDTGLRYIDTVQQAGGKLIWHVFEKP